MNLKISRVFVTALAVLSFSVAPFAQQPADVAKPDAAKPGAAATEAKAAPKVAEETAPIVTHHEVHAGGKLLKYTATVGLMPLKNEKGETEANIFYMAYTLDQPEGTKTKRPLMFSFNGGPGAASVWLHLGAIGPRQIKMQPEGFMPAPPYQVTDNNDTWLTQTDLVFLDTVGTGYSRAVKPELRPKFLGVQGDIKSVGEFIRLYLTRYERWSSPLFLVGESYGTTRASGLSGYLLQHGIALNGIVLVSAVLNFETLEFVPGNDLPYQLYLPSYTATAWYHKKLDSSLGDLKTALKASEQFAAGPYADALAKGDRLTAQEHQQIVEGLAKFTGLSKIYIEQSNLRVDEPHFTRELLRDERKSAGRIDSRFSGVESDGVAETSTYDPFVSAIVPPYTAAVNSYIRGELGYKSDEEYYVLGGGFHHNEWDWGNAREGFPNVTGSLRTAFAQNPYMKLFVANGYFDLATPYFATEYTFAHMGLQPDEKKRISAGYYEAGHMMYVRQSDMQKLHSDVANFIGSALQ